MNPIFSLIMIAAGAALERSVLGPQRQARRAARVENIIASCLALAPSRPDAALMSMLSWRLGAEGVPNTHSVDDLHAAVATMAGRMAPQRGATGNPVAPSNIADPLAADAPKPRMGFKP